MKLRFLPFLLLCFSFAILGSHPTAAGGCGWDYPCPPEPGYRSSQVTIQNYGHVNIYTSKRAWPAQGAENPGFSPGYCLDDPCRIGCGGYPCAEKCGTLCWMRRFRQGYCGHGCQSYIENARIEAEERAEWKAGQEGQRPPPSDEWMYEKHTECAPPYCPPDYDAPPSPPPGPRYYRRAPERYYDAPPAPLPPRQEPLSPDLTPRGRFEGPRYPPK
jgi:hypothetical protein